MIDTGRVSPRRSIRFDSIKAMYADVDRLVAAERAGTLKRLGNWTLGQALGHLAVWAEYAFTGPPVKPPFFVRWLLRGKKNEFLSKGMPAGVRIPRVPGGTLGTDDLPLDTALARLRVAFDRLAREAPTTPNAMFGPLNHEEWIALNLRHAELHLSFFEA